MTNKKFSYILIFQGILILLLLLLNFQQKEPEEGNYALVPLNKITNKNLQKVIEQFIDTTKNYDYNFVTVNDISSYNSGELSFRISFTDELNLISSDLCLNVICQKIKGKEIVFRPINYDKSFVKSVDTMIVHYIMEYNPRVANSLKELILINSMQEDRDILNVTGPITPEIIVNFRRDGEILNIICNNF